MRNVDKRKLVSGFFVIVMAMAVVLPGSAIFSGGTEARIHGDYVIIRDVAPRQLEELSRMGFNIAENYGAFALIEANPTQRMFLEVNGFEIIDVSTTILLPTIQFDTKNGCLELPVNLKVDKTNYYLIQFIGPIREEWTKEIEQMGGVLHGYWSDYAFVVKADATAIERINGLRYIRWVEMYQPAYKIHSQFPTEGVTQVEVFVYHGEDVNGVASQLTQMGVEVFYVNQKDSGPSVVRTFADVSLIPAIVNIEEVQDIRIWEQERTHNDKAHTMLKADDAWYASTSGIRIVPAENVGLTGNGQVVGLHDSGFDTGSASSGHYDFFNGPFGNRVIAVRHTSSNEYFSSQIDYSGHGTHCAGTILGNGHCAELWKGHTTTDREYHDEMTFSGQAPEAKLTMDGCGSRTEGSSTLYSKIPEAWNLQKGDGAYIHSNSWGGGMNNYGSSSETADQFMWDNTNSLVIFSVGNEGSNTYTVGDGACAKNDFTVGACGNDRLSDKFPSDPNVIIDFSSRGPGPGDMIEPQIVAPGESIISTQSSMIKREDDYRFSGTGGNEYNTGGFRKDYIYMSGTSMSTPAIAGLAALARQYYKDNQSITPSGVLLKATLINGAQDLGYEYPYDNDLGFGWSPHQGWGRGNIKNAVFPSAPSTMQYAQQTGINTGVTWDAVTNGGMDLWVKSPNAPLKVTLVWLDTAGNEGKLSNDLDLRVISPVGTEYRGNQLDTWSFENPGIWDTTNNHERVLVEEPIEGNYTIEVIGTNVPQGAGVAFALVVSADFGPQKSYCVELTEKSHTTLSVVQDGSTNFLFNTLNFGSESDIIDFSSEGVPTGLTVDFDPDPVSLLSGEDTDVITKIAASSTIAYGAYTFSIKGVSQSDLSTPKAQDKIDLVVEVLSEPLPDREQLTTSDLSENSPDILTYEYGGKKWIWITYVIATPDGALPFVTWSSDNGASWTDPKKLYISPDSISNPRLYRNKYNNRIFIVWHGWNPTKTEKGSWCRLVYADYSNNYESWTDPILVDENGGASYENHKRCVNMAIMSATKVFVFNEVLRRASNGASETNDIIYFESADNGETWGGLKYPYGASDDIWEFFPEVAVDENNNIWLVYYIREDADNRILFNQTYDGSSWSTRDKIGPGAQPGTQNLHPYVFCPGDGNVYVSWIDKDPTYDDPGTLNVTFSNLTTVSWVAAKGPFGTSVSEAGYTEGRYLQSMKMTSDGRIWLAYLEEESIYEATQLHVIYTNDKFENTELYKVTADAYGKGYQSIGAIGSYIYESFHADYAGNTDIYWTKYSTTDADYQQNPDPELDIWGPRTRYVGASPNPVIEGSDPGSIKLLATIDDTGTGFTNIKGAEWVWSDATNPNDVSWAGAQEMYASDGGGFNSAIESVERDIDISAKAPGTYRIWVRGNDTSENWGTEKASYIDLVVVPKFVVSIIEPVVDEKVQQETHYEIIWNIGSGGDPSFTIDLYYSVDDGPYNPIVTGLNQPSSGPGSYTWNTPKIRSSNVKIKANVTDSVDHTDFDYSDQFAIDFFLYFNIETPGIGGYQNLSRDDPFESAVQIASEKITTVGDHQIGSKWITDELATESDIEGIWTFGVYGKMNGTQIVSGKLYAKVYQNNSGGSPILLFTTGEDDIDISTSAKRTFFTWDYLASSATVPAGDRIYAELWINAIEASEYNEPQISNSEFNDNANGWTSETGGNESFKVTNEWSGSEGNPNPNGSITTYIEGRAGKYSSTGTGTWMTEFVYDKGKPTSANLSFDWKVTQFKNGTEGEPNRFTIKLIQPISGIAIIYPIVGLNGTTGWNSVTNYEIPIRYFNESGTYKLEIYTELHVASKKASLVQIFYDNVKIKIGIIPEFKMEYDNKDTDSFISSPTLRLGAEVTFEIELVAGLNLISIPLNVTDPDAAPFDAQDLIDLINACNGDAASVSRWVAATGTWDTFNDQGTSPFEIEPWEGYFVNCNKASTWNATGKLQESEPVDLVAGLTLIGVSKDMGSGYDAQDLLVDIGPDAQAVSRWIAATGTWDTFNRNGSSPFEIKQGVGYFVNCDQASTWNP